MAAAHYVVIGSGLAGYGVVRELRRLAPDAAITVVTRDAGHFYSKPALSTALAKAKSPDGLVTMNAEKMVASQRIELVANSDVTAIDRESRSLSLGGRQLQYDALILATGAAPIRPLLAGDAADAAISVNSLDDYARLRTCLGPGGSVAIIGAGLVGSEFANDLSQAGHGVTVIDPLPTPLGQLVPAVVGEALRDALAAQGVKWRLGCSVSAIDRAGADYSLTLADGETLIASVVLSAVGLRPDTALAAAAGLATDHGVLVDAHGRTSDPHIFALGDCAQYPHGSSAFVTPIMTAARAIAATASGTPTPMTFPALSVQVKTSACPLVLLSPPKGAEGTWILAEGDSSGQKFLFLSSKGMVMGYAMTGDFCEQRMELDRLIASASTLR